MQCNTFTVVTHPVGYHRDYFKRESNGSKRPSLENKTTFTTTRKAGHSIGRGGNGYQYTWALLDWKNLHAGRRRAAYVAAGGNAPILTQGRWRQFLLEPGNLLAVVQAVPAMRGSDIIPEEDGLRQLSQVIQPN